MRRIVRPSTRRACAWVLGWNKPKQALAERDDRRRSVQTLCRIEQAIADAGNLAHQFIGLERCRDLEGFDRWVLQFLVGVNTLPVVRRRNPNAAIPAAATSAREPGSGTAATARPNNWSALIWPTNDAAPVFRLTVYKPSTPPTRRDAKPMFKPFAAVKMSNPTKAIGIEVERSDSIQDTAIRTCGSDKCIEHIIGVKQLGSRGDIPVAVGITCIDKIGIAAEINVANCIGEGTVGRGRATNGIDTAIFIIGRYQTQTIHDGIEVKAQ